MRKQILVLSVVAILSGGSLVACGGQKQKKNEYTPDGKLEVSIRNLYFGSYEGGDPYTKELEDKFGIKIHISKYDWSNWETQTTSAASASNVDDLFHANIDSYNFGNIYRFWAEEDLIKPLPDDLSRWPYIKDMLEHTSCIDNLKIDGKLYGIPVSKNTTDYDLSFSPFTYIYRRDWAKNLGVYKENDEYTWTEFKELLEAFKGYCEGKTDFAALADIEWGYPSIINFYKQVPHCFAKDATTGKYVNNYTTDEYIAGLQEAKLFQDNGWYHENQNANDKGSMNDKYTYNRVGILYENLTYSNYIAIRTKLKNSNSSNKSFNLDDATAIMKIRGTDGKYALEGTDNWFAMSFFDGRIDDTKQGKLLDLMNYLLSPEGTTFAIYGKEGFDYEMVNGKPQIIPENWDDGEGNMVGPNNGAKFLRETVSLGYDTQAYDPTIDQTAFSYLNSWESEMKAALKKGELKVLKEEDEVRWVETPFKNANVGRMRTAALKNVMKYTYGELSTIDKYKSSFSEAEWTKLLKEVNSALNK